jgi:hypothetical protein
MLQVESRDIVVEKASTPAIGIVGGASHASAETKLIMT